MVMEYQKIAPGRILQWGYMSNNDLDSVSLAARMDNVGPGEIEGIINGSPISKTMSKKLGKLMNTHENFWFNLQRNYDNAMKLEELETEIMSAMIEKAGVAPRKVKKELEQQIVILAAFSVGELNTEIRSGHAQKILFIFDKGINKTGRLFNHVRHKHGPNDFNLDSILLRMEMEGFLSRDFPNENTDRIKEIFVLTTEGHSIGQKILETMPDTIKSQIKEMVNWVLSMSMPQLKDEIYKKYPRMKPKQ